MHGEMQFKCTDCHSRRLGRQAAAPGEAEAGQPARAATRRPSRSTPATAHGKARKDGNTVGGHLHTTATAPHDIKRSKRPDVADRLRQHRGHLRRLPRQRQDRRSRRTCPAATSRPSTTTASTTRLLEGKRVYSARGADLHLLPRRARHPGRRTSPTAALRARTSRRPAAAATSARTTVVRQGQARPAAAGGRRRRRRSAPTATARTRSSARARPTWQNAVVGACGNCHDDYITSLPRHVSRQGDDAGLRARWPPAPRATARTTSGRRPNPLSMVSPANRLETCRNCHPQAGAQVRQLGSASAADTTRSATRSCTGRNIFMEVLLAGVFLFFGLHTVLWAYRVR
ncbi:MAG: hypothetical protein M0C28_11505 [Candidatus Moduliflexus flocculans]|nr:hypothetical protein [Candidatus Moduliflexus flocculans]